jgi:hypothetical protein
LLCPGGVTPVPVRSNESVLNVEIWPGVPARLVHSARPVFEIDWPGRSRDWSGRNPSTTIVIVRTALRAKLKPDPVVESVQPAASEPVNWKFAAVTRPAVSVTENVGATPPFTIIEPRTFFGSGSEYVTSNASALLAPECLRTIV